MTVRTLDARKVAALLQSLVNHSLDDVLVSGVSTGLTQFHSFVVGHKMMFISNSKLRRVNAEDVEAPTTVSKVSFKTQVDNFIFLNELN